MDNLNLEMYKKMVLIREVEKAIQAHYLEDEMKTPMHMSMGEEAVVVGVCHALSEKDQVLGTYRSHALYLARTGETDNFFSEMYGKVSGVAKGKAGSMHLIAPESGLICTSAVVGTHIPVALGAAFANRYKKKDNIVAVFFGDGAIDEGVFWESVNIASLMKLPVLFICEDNEYAVHNPGIDRHGYDSISSIIDNFNCNVFSSDSTDVEEVFNLTEKAVEGIKKGEGPSFLHLKYYRYLEHVGVFEDFKADYRPREEFDKWLERDPILLQRRKLLCQMKENAIKEIENTIIEQIKRSVINAGNMPFPGEEVLVEDLYA